MLPSLEASDVGSDVPMDNAEDDAAAADDDDDLMKEGRPEGRGGPPLDMKSHISSISVRSGGW